jgi:hypothetical protein
MTPDQSNNETEMTLKIAPEDLVVGESQNDQFLTISVLATAAGSNYSNIAYFICQPLPRAVEEPFLSGEDYPTLVNAWDNKDDDIFDNL